MTDPQRSLPEPAVADRRDGVFVVQRPWGSFQQFASNEPVTVKTITVQPGQRLSLQRHARRAEMWQVLSGQLDITVDDRTWSAAEGELVWIGVGQRHRLGNSSTEPGTLLEIGFGHFDEDDIERLHDDYSR